MLRDYCFTLLALVLLPVCIDVYAQIRTDGTLGVGKPLDGPNYTIGADLGQQKGGNLFHSFQEFNIGTNETATFSGPDTVKNIISRVTGGSSSSIDGTLRSTIPDANMYLLNPSGIMFGQNARLDVLGSFHASTANVLHLGGEDGGQFNATNPNNSLLTVAQPVAFGFLGNPAPIHIQGSSLSVGKGKEMSFISGNILVEDKDEQSAELTAVDGGRLNLAAIASAGMVTVVDKPDLEPNLMVASSQKGEVTLSNSNISMGGTQGGQIFIRAGQLFLKKVTFLRADALGSQGSLIDIAVDKNMEVTESSEIGIYNDKDATAQDSRINISATNIEFGGTYPAQLKYELGNIVQKLETLSPAELVSQYSIGPRDADFLLGEVKSLLDQNQDKDISFQMVIDRLGRDKIAWPYIRLFSPAFSKITNGDSSNSTSAKAGSIRINTSNLTIDTGFIESFSDGSGKAGDLNITADKVTLQNFGYLNTAVGIDPGKGLNNGGSGQGGNITVKANELISLSGFSTISVSAAPDTSGNAGEISLNTPSLKLDDYAEVNSFSDGRGDPGSVNIETNVASMTNNSSIYAKAVSAIGGNITLNVRDGLHLNNSKITAETTSNNPDDRGGNLIIGKPYWLTLHQSQLVASAGPGHGGKISIDAKYIIGNILQPENYLGEKGREERVKLGYSVIDVTSKDKHVNGEVVIKNCDDPKNKQCFRTWEVISQSSKMLLPSLLSLNRCSFSKENQSRFIITARDILPRCPEDLRTPTMRLWR